MSNSEKVVNKSNKKKSNDESITKVNNEDLIKDKKVNIKNNLRSKKLDDLVTKLKKGEGNIYEIFNLI